MLVFKCKKRGVKCLTASTLHFCPCLLGRGPFSSLPFRKFETFNLDDFKSIYIHIFLKGYIERITGVVFADMSKHFYCKG